MNRAIACAVSLAPSQWDWFPFLECLEARAQGAKPEGLDVEAGAHDCAVHAGIEPGRVLSCYNGGWGPGGLGGGGGAAGAKLGAS
jgi:hypothetical protein